MKKIIFFLLAISSLKSFGQSSIIDFGNSAEKNQEWVLLSDNIMGGITKSKIEYTDNSVLLSGSIPSTNPIIFYPSMLHNFAVAIVRCCLFFGR
jgi:hypothetical protein